MDSYKNVYLSQNIDLFCLFLQPSCFCHCVAAKQDIILLVLLGTNTFFPPQTFILWKSRARSAGRLPIALELHWHRRDQTTNDSRLARLPRPSTYKVVPGHLSLTSKIVMKEDIKPKETSKMLIQGLIRAAGTPIPTSKLRVFYFTRLLSPKDTNLVANLSKFSADPICLFSPFNT